MISTQMTRAEKRAVAGIGLIMAVRMFGLFMILPVFALYARHLEGTTSTLVGLAIGIYGLTQALLQIPFGMLSDRLGRKPVITAGLLIFAAGSVLAAMSDSIYGVIMGRALQGAGAISAALMALTADLTREEHRTKAMAFTGMSIGMAFLLALVSGPLLDKWIGVPGIFWTIAALAFVGMAILHLQVPTPAHSIFHRDTEPVPQQFKRMLSDPQLLRLDFGILMLHAQLSAMFVVLPLALHESAGLDSGHHWLLYLPVMLASVALMVPFIIIAEKYHRLKQVFSGAVLVLALAQAGLAGFHHSLADIVILLILFFTAFNLLEASLPSLISKIAPPDSKGTAMGVYTTSQFLGIFLGGLAGGWLHHHYGISAVLWFGVAQAVVWLGLALTMQAPRYLSSHMLNVGELDPLRARDLTSRLRRIPGVEEAVVIVEDGVAYLKIDRAVLDMDRLEEFSAP